MKSKTFIFSCLDTQILKKTNQLDHFSALFQLGFFAPNQGLTIANALRRTLLMQKMHYAIAGVFIQNIKHEYSCLKGIKETVLDLLINLEKIVFSSQKINTKTHITCLFVRGPKIVRAKDIPLPSCLFCINPEQYIATLDVNATLKITFFINNFENHSCIKITTDFYTKLYSQFISPQNQQLHFQKKHFLLLETHFSPILNINYTIKKNVLNQEILLFNICTNGSIHPSVILQKSIQDLILCLIPFYQINQSKPVYKWTNVKKKKNTLLLNKKFLKKILCLDLSNFHLSQRTYQTLKNFNLFTLGDLYKFSFKSSKRFKQLYNFEYKELQIFLLKFKLYIQNL